MIGLIDMEQKGCVLIGSGTHFVALNFDISHDFDLQFSRSDIEKAVFKEWEDWLTWNKSNVSWYDAGPTILPWAMTLTLDFKGQNLKKLYPWTGMAD